MFVINAFAWTEYMVTATGAPLAGYIKSLWCAACAAHYGDSGLCDEGKPAASPHRRGVPRYLKEVR